MKSDGLKLFNPLTINLLHLFCIAGAEISTDSLTLHLTWHQNQDYTGWMALGVRNK